MPVTHEEQTRDGVCCDSALPETINSFLFLAESTCSQSGWQAACDVGALRQARAASRTPEDVVKSSVTLCNVIVAILLHCGGGRDPFSQEVETHLCSQLEVLLVQRGICIC